MKKLMVFLLSCIVVFHLGRLAGDTGLFDGAFDKVKGFIQDFCSYQGQELAALTEGEEMRFDVVPVLNLHNEIEFALNSGEAKANEVDDYVFIGDLDIRNDSSIELDINSLIAQKPTLSSVTGEPQVLIIHTHGSEAYTQSEGDNYVESDPYRTEDKSRNVIKVGDVLAEVLEEKGIGVIHDRELYDSPSYTGSYTRSGKAVETYLREFPSIAVVIDLHRDAIGSGGTAYKTKAEPALGSCAQVMVLIGTGENGLNHPNWQENMKLALRIQQAMEDRYPGLARPLAVKSERYNQHLSTGAMIVEVGSNGNTLAEAVTAIRLFGDAAGDVLKSLIECE